MILAHTSAPSAWVNLAPAVTPIASGPVEREGGTSQPGGAGVETPAPTPSADPWPLRDSHPCRVDL